MAKKEKELTTQELYYLMMGAKEIIDYYAKTAQLNQGNGGEYFNMVSEKYNRYHAIYSEIKEKFEKRLEDVI